MAAVAEQERALGFLEESLAGLSHGDGAPVPACETERSEGSEGLGGQEGLRRRGVAAAAPDACRYWKVVATQRTSCAGSQGEGAGGEDRGGAGGGEGGGQHGGFSSSSWRTDAASATISDWVQLC